MRGRAGSGGSRKYHTTCQVNYSCRRRGRGGWGARGGEQRGRGGARWKAQRHDEREAGRRDGGVEEQGKENLGWTSEELEVHFPTDK